MSSIILKLFYSFFTVVYSVNFLKCFLILLLVNSLKYTCYTAYHRHSSYKTLFLFWYIPYVHFVLIYISKVLKQYKNSIKSDNCIKNNLNKGLIKRKASVNRGRDVYKRQTKIHSIAGILPKDTPLLTSRPFRAPHHTASPGALAGGGIVPRPGEISLRCV